MNLLDSLTPEMLDEEQRQLADCIGMEAYRSLVKNYAGSNIYVHMPDKLTVNIRNEIIRSEFNGYNYHELAIKYKLSEVMIRRIVSPVISAVKSTPINGQISLFDDETET